MPNKTASLPIASGQKVYLCALNQEDQTDLLALNNQHAEYHAQWLNTVKTPKDFQKDLKLIESPNYEILTIRTINDNSLAGALLAGPIFMVNKHCSIGFYSYPEYQGKGYMKEGIGLAIDWLFKEFNLHRIEACAKIGNTPSIGLLLRLGFKIEGYYPKYRQIAGKWEDHIGLGLLKEYLL